MSLTAVKSYFEGWHGVDAEFTLRQHLAMHAKGNQAESAAHAGVAHRQLRIGVTGHAHR
jgi:hypothetical protein